MQPLHDDVVVIPEQRVIILVLLGRLAHGLHRLLYHVPHHGLKVEDVIVVHVDGLLVEDLRTARQLSLILVLAFQELELERFRALQFYVC